MYIAIHWIYCVWFVELINRPRDLSVSHSCPGQGLSKLVTQPICPLNWQTFAFGKSYFQAVAYLYVSKGVYSMNIPMEGEGRDLSRTAMHATKFCSLMPTKVLQWVRASYTWKMLRHDSVASRSPTPSPTHGSMDGPIDIQSCFPTQSNQITVFLVSLS